MPKAFPDLPEAALDNDNAIDHLPTFLGGNHVVDGEGGGPAGLEVGGGGGPAGFPDLPEAALDNDNAIDHLPTFLGGNHVVSDWLLF
jgi:hypothetical protein